MKIIIFLFFIIFTKIAVAQSRPCSGQHGSRHPNGGGFVSATARVSPTAYVSASASVCDTATVSGFARIADMAIVSGAASVAENASLSGHARVYGHASVFGLAAVSDYVRVFDSATVSGNTNLSDHAVVFGHAHFFGDSSASGHVRICGGDIFSQDITTDLCTHKDFGSQSSLPPAGVSDERRDNSIPSSKNQQIIGHGRIGDDVISR